MKESSVPGLSGDHVEKLVRLIKDGLCALRWLEDL